MRLLKLFIDRKWDYYRTSGINEQMTLWRTPFWAEGLQAVTVDQQGTDRISHILSAQFPAPLLKEAVRYQERAPLSFNILLIDENTSHVTVCCLIHWIREIIPWSKIVNRIYQESKYNKYDFYHRLSDQWCHKPAAAHKSNPVWLCLWPRRCDRSLPAC